MKTDRARLKLRIVAAIRGERGVSMLEFAFVALPLFMFIFGILEVGLIFWGTYDLDLATSSAARLIRTGQAQNANMSQTQMITQICSQVSILSNCANKLQLRVESKSFSTFTDVQSFLQSPASSPLNLGNLGTSFPYEPGGPSTVNLVTAYYEWPLIGISALWPGKLADGNVLLQSSAVLQTEPF